MKALPSLVIMNKAAINTDVQLFCVNVKFSSHLVNTS